jgi:hypothetical protein
MKITLVQAENVLRKVVGYLGLIEGVTNQVHAPVAVRTAIATVSGVLLTVDHYLANPKAVVK